MLLPNSFSKDDSIYVLGVISEKRKPDGFGFKRAALVISDYPEKELIQFMPAKL